jgi:hypothetical protein
MNPLASRVGEAVEGADPDRHAASPQRADDGQAGVGGRVGDEHRGIAGHDLSWRLSTGVGEAITSRYGAGW